MWRDKLIYMAINIILCKMGRGAGDEREARPRHVGGCTFFLEIRCSQCKI